MILVKLFQSTNTTKMLYVVLRRPFRNNSFAYTHMTLHEAMKNLLPLYNAAIQFIRNGIDTDHVSQQCSIKTSVPFGTQL